MKKSDIKKLVKESIKELKEQAYGSATLTTMGAPRTGTVAPAGIDPYTGRVEYPETIRPLTKNGMWEQEETDLITTAEEMFGVAAIEQFGRIHLYPDNKPEDKKYISYRTNKTYIIVKDDLKTIEYISGHSSPEFADLGNSLGLNKIGSGQFAGIDTYEGPHTVNSLEDMKDIINKMEAVTSGEAKRQSAFYTRKPGEGGTGIDEDSIRINMEQAPPGGEEEEGKEELKSKEEPPKHSLEKIGKCKAGCIDLEIENLEIKVENLETKLSDISKKRGDAKPSEIEGLEKQKTEFLAQIIATDEQIESKKEEQKKLLNPEEQKESINKKNMKNNVKQLWSDYANSRIGSNLKENQKSERKLARRKILQEGVMNTFFEYFSQGNTNEEIVQLYAGKGVQVPEQFVKSARSQFENQTKLNAEMEMSELNFKNEASQIINNPATMEMDGSTTEDDKQLAAGLFKEQDEIPVKPEKEHKDVDMLLKRISTINIPGEFESVFKKLMTHSTEISGLSTSKVIGMLKQAIKEI